MSTLDRVRLQLDRVRAVVGEIDPVFLDTPALLCAPLGQALGCSVTLKVETLSPVRSFKGRGTETVAAVALKRGTSRVVCASAGNLGQALAYSGSRRGLAASTATTVPAIVATGRRLAFRRTLPVDGMAGIVPRSSGRMLCHVRTRRSAVVQPGSGAATEARARLRLAGSTVTRPRGCAS